MATLLAQGAAPDQRWRRTLPVEEWTPLGRATPPLAAEWDEKISRRHAEVRCADGKLHVRRLPESRNPIFVRGREAKEFSLAPGEYFVIGGTSFTFAVDQINVSMDMPAPAAEQLFNPAEIQRLRFRNADQRLEVLSRLPDVIAGASTDAELFIRLVNMLLAGVLRAEAAAVVELDPTGPLDAPPQVLHWDRRLAGDAPFHPSQRLILEAVRIRKQTVLHTWAGGGGGKAAFTQADNSDWAFCTPVQGTACPGWGIYVSGRVSRTPGIGSDGPDLRDDVKFTELVAALLSSLLQIRKLQRQQTALSQFFSPVVLGSLTARDPEEILAPRETEVSVLFCDLRGFSRQSERSGADLLGLLERVSKALGVMTHQILGEGGVIGDFQGDAAMGFWGWPLAQEDRVERACRAALGIRAFFSEAARTRDHALADFRMGIGIATGRAVAGKIGTQDQGKVTVFGPVVNLASRLEGMTKQLHAPILLDQTSADRVRERLPREVGRCRTVATIKPYGLETPLTVTELLPPVSLDPTLSDENIRDYEAAVDLLREGKWPEAFQRLHRVPPDDLVKDFLMVYIAQHNRSAPPDWKGFISLTSK